MRTVRTLLLQAASIASIGSPAQPGPPHAPEQGPPFECASNELHLIAPPGGFTPEQLAGMEAARLELEAFTRGFERSWSPDQRDTYVIPVVFHIIHDNGPENISDAQVRDVVRILNEDFNKRNPEWPNTRPEFLPLVADVGIGFQLARRDPNGNCTSGITRTVSGLTHDGRQAMTSLIQWPRNRYMNVWVSASAGGEGTAGYTNYPSSVHNSPSRDGIVMRHDYVGTIGTSASGRGHVLTHEVGHWLNLPHIWGSSNTPGEQGNCSMDDGVADTPNTVGWRSCYLGASTCDATLDNVENYMDYAYCYKMFTNGQAARMLAALNATTAQRNQLWQPSNLALTATDGTPMLCAAGFTSGSTAICAGGTVTFTDASYHGVTTWAWDFPGGTPATSTDPNPTVTYAQPGTYPVHLTVGDGFSTASTSRQDLITVQADPGAPIPMEEGFETHPDLGASPWTVVGPDSNSTFAITDAAAFSGNNSARVLNEASMSGEVDELVSETYDMSGATAIRISFRYAYAQRTPDDDDRLRVHVSNNCGATWALRQQLRGPTTLGTTGAPVTGSFVPAGPGEWRYAEIANISSAYHARNFRVRFEFESGGGNNLYIDDINIVGSTVGIDDPAATNGGALTVVPNPVEGGDAQAVFSLARAGQARIELMDVLGRRLAVLHDGQLAAGPQRVELPVGTLQGGLYLVRLRQEDRDETVRLVVR